LSSVYMQPVLYWFSFNSLLLIVWCFCEAYNFNFLFFCHNLLYIFPIFLINLAFHHNQLSYVYVHFIIAPFSLQYSIVLIIWRNFFSTVLCRRDKTWRLASVVHYLARELFLIWFCYLYSFYLLFYKFHIY